MTASRDRQFLHDDSGVALLTVIGVVAVMTALATIGYFLASQSFVSTEVFQGEAQAFQVANAGVDTLYADIAANSSAALDNYEETRTIEVGGGMCEVKLTSLSGLEYLATAVGSTADGAQESIQVRFYYLNLWEMFIAAGEDEDSIGGGKINGNASIDGPFYVRGDLAATGSADFTRGPLFVTGDISSKGAFTIGTTAVPIDVYVGGAYPTAWPGNKNFHANRVSNRVPDLTAPIVDEAFLDAALSRAKRESIDNLEGTPEFAPVQNVEVVDDGTDDASTYATALGGTWTRPKAPGASLFYKYIGNDAGRASMNAGTTNLTLGANSFGSWENDGHGYTTGEWDDFAYNSAGAVDVLYIDGTVFIDGDLTFSNETVYKGNGALIVNGNVTITNDLNPASGSMNDREVLGIISTGVVTVNGDGNWGPFNTQGALYAKEQLDFGKANSSFKGSIVSPQINFPQANFHLVSEPQLPRFLPWSMPGRNTPFLIIGDWTRQ